MNSPGHLDAGTVHKEHKIMVGGRVDQLETLRHRNDGSASRLYEIVVTILWDSAEPGIPKVLTYDD